MNLTLRLERAESSHGERPAVELGRLQALRRGRRASINAF